MLPINGILEKVWLAVVKQAADSKVALGQSDLCLHSANVIAGSVNPEIVTALVKSSALTSGATGGG